MTLAKSSPVPTQHSRLYRQHDAQCIPTTNLLGDQTTILCLGPNTAMPEAFKPSVGGGMMAAAAAGKLLKKSVQHSHASLPERRARAPGGGARVSSAREITPHHLPRRSRATPTEDAAAWRLRDSIWFRVATADATTVRRRRSATPQERQQPSGEHDQAARRTCGAAEEGVRGGARRGA